MPSNDLSQVAEYIESRRRGDDALIASLTPPKPQFSPEQRLGMIEQRAGELIKTHPDRDPNVLQAGLDEIREWQDVPENYPVVEDLERLGKERMTRLEAEKETEYHPWGAAKHTFWQGVKAVGGGLPAAVGRLIPGDDVMDRVGRENKAYYDRIMSEDPDIQAYSKSVQQESEGFATEVLGNLGPTAAGLGMAFLPVAGPVLATGMFYDLNTSEIEDMARRKGATEDHAQRVGVAGGIINTALDMTGIGRLMKVFKPARKLSSFLVGLGLTSGIEGGTEGLQGVVADILSDWAAKPKDETTEAFIERQLARKDELIKTFAHDAKIGAAIGAGGHVVAAGVGGAVKTETKPPVDQGMAGGSGEVDALAKTESSKESPAATVKGPVETPKKSASPEADAPLGAGSGEVDAAARPAEPAKTIEPPPPPKTPSVDTLLETPPETPLPSQPAADLVLPELPATAQAEMAPAPERVAPQMQPVPGQELTPDAIPVVPEAGLLKPDETPQPARVMTVPTESLSVDPDRFQYKRGMGQGGAGAKLKKLREYNPELGGILAVWNDPSDNKTYVVNGHHRFELAKRTEYPEVAVHVLEAENAAEARTKGALINIAEGQGNADDAANIFRDAGITPESLERDYHISLKGDVAREGMALSRLEMGIFKRVERGDMPKTWGVVIGENLPDPQSQLELVKYLDKQEKAGKRVSAETIEQMIEELKGAPRKEEEQMGLFGVEAFSRPLLQERAEIRAYVIKRLADDKRLFGSVANIRKAQRLQAEGNVLDVEKNLDIAEKSAIIKEAFEKLAAYGGPVSDMLNRAAEDYANATGKERVHVKQKFFDQIRKEIPTLVKGGFGVVSEGASEYSGPEPSGARSAFGEIGEAGRKTFGLTPDTRASQLHLFPKTNTKSLQGNLFEDAKDKIKFKRPKGQGAAALGSLRARQHTRMVSTGGSVRAQSLHIHDLHGAASLLRSIRRQRQENLYAVTTR